MRAAPLTRRDFLTDSSRTAAVGWLALQLPWLAAMAGCARQDAQQGAAFVRLTPLEGRTMRAFAAQIIPSGDGAPGAEEAGAVHFVDRALDMPLFADRVSLIHTGLAELDAAARDTHKVEFASLSGEQQIAMMKRIEREPFFIAARMLVVVGTFADPTYGGNRNDAGWMLMGIDHRAAYSAPFGWYDAQAASSTAPNAA